MNLTKISMAAGVAALMVSATAVAANPGFFAGVNAGYSMARMSDGPVVATGNTGIGIVETNQIRGTKEHGYTYGVDGGYNFSKYFGVEANFTHYANLELGNFSTTGGEDGASQTASNTLKFYDIDVTANGYLPVYNKVDLVGKAGLAYVKENHASKAHFYRPKLAVGVSYAATSNINVTATYSRIFKQGSSLGSTKRLPNLDLAAVAVDYSF